MHVDVETDEVYIQMTLQPLTLQEQKDTFLPVELGIPNRQPTNYFCKTITARDTSTHGGFSVPRRAADKVFPPLDFSQQPPAQELIARDLIDNEWKFRHVFRGRKAHGVNGNYLLNFHYDSVNRPQPRANPPRRLPKRKPYNKDLFLQANYKFVLLDSGNRIAVCRRSSSPYRKE